MGRASRPELEQAEAAGYSNRAASRAERHVGDRDRPGGGGGYSGKYLDLQVPADISECDVYRAWEYWWYAQGPGHRWHLWILDVDSVRVVIQSMDYEGTTAEVQAELEAIVDSIQIES